MARRPSYLTIADGGARGDVSGPGYATRVVCALTLALPATWLALFAYPEALSPSRGESAIPDVIPYALLVLSAGCLGWVLSSLLPVVPGGRAARGAGDGDVDLSPAPFGVAAFPWFVCDGDGILVAVSSGFSSLTGRRGAALTGRSIGEFCPEMDGEQLRELLAGRLPSAPVMLAFHSGPGSTLFLDVLWTVRRDAAGPVRLCGIVSGHLSGGETGARKRIPGRGTDGGFRYFFDASPLGVAILDQDGIIRQCNPAFLELAGVADIAEGHDSFPELAGPEYRDDIRDRLSRVHGGGTEPVEVVFSGNGARSFQLDLTPLPGRRPAVLVHLLDVTGRKDLESQFAQAQKMQALGQLAGGLAHDFNNHLTTMMGLCQLLLERYRPGDPSFSDVDGIFRSASRAASLVRQLLAFSRRQTLQPEILNVSTTLYDEKALIEPLVGETVRVIVEPQKDPRDTSLVRVDRSQFQQVLMNLAINARDAMPDGGELTLRAGNVRQENAPGRSLHELVPPGEYVLIEVSDTGCGIPETHRGKIFEPFYTTKEVGKGTGLGLSTVYGIVKQTGGYIFVSSRPGKGTTFSIWLPRYRGGEGRLPQAPRMDEALPAQDLTGRETILLVEDEDSVRVVASRILRAKGYCVIEASSGHEALERLKESGAEVDLIISDVVMPNMTGTVLAQEVQKLHPDVKILLVSGYAEGAFRKDLDRPLGVHFLPKPFTLRQLTTRVREILGGAAGKYIFPENDPARRGTAAPQATGVDAGTAAGRIPGRPVVRREAP